MTALAEIVFATEAQLDRDIADLTAGAALPRLNRLRPETGSMSHRSTSSKGMR